MNISRLTLLGALLAAFSLVSLAGDKIRGMNLGKAVSVSVKSSDVKSTSVERTALASSFTLAPGELKVIETQVDVNGAKNVGISITTLEDPDSKLTNVKVGVAFGEPGEWYILTDVIDCSKFYFMDHGGATVPVYGSFMKLMLNNEGTMPVKVTRLAYYMAR